MPDWLTEAPLLAIAALFGVAVLRGQAIYWVARGASSGASAAVRSDAPGRRTRVRRLLDSPAVERARAAMNRWGLILVPLCYLTVGLQTAVLAAAGALGVPWLRFTLVQLPGCLAWGIIYGTIGFAAWEAAVGAAFTSPLALALVASAAALVLGTWLTRRLRTR